MFTKYLRHFCSLCLALTAAISGAPASAPQEQSSVVVDWDKVHQAWEAYLSYPSGEKAYKVAALLPGSVWHPGDQVDKEKFEGVFYRMEGTLGFLERQVYSSDQAAVRLAFRLYSIADGSFAEALDILLGALIRINPRLFLEELSNNRPLVLRLDSLVGNTGPEYVDRSQADRLEMSLRVRALERVKGRSLRKTRDECIRALEDQLAQPGNE